MSIIGDILGARSAAKGQKQAADAASRAAADSLAEQRRQYDQTRADNEPFRQVGIGAIGRLDRASSGSMDDFTASPDYQFRLDEGARALTARNSALGIQNSGAAQKAALRFGQNIASGEYGDWWNRQAGLAGVGQTANSANQGAGQYFAGATTNINQNKAQALGSSYVNRGNIWGNYFGNLGGQVDRAALKMFGM